MIKQWFAVRTATRQEGRATDALKEAGFETYFPQEIRFKRLRSGEQDESDTVERPLIVGYVFFKAAPHLVHLAEALEGVHALVCYRDDAGRLKPFPIPATEIDKLRAMVDEGTFDWTKRNGAYQPTLGDRVRIKQGPFTGYLATVLSMSPTERRVTIGLDKGTAKIAVDHLEAAA